MSTRIDLSEADGFDPIPAGAYPVTVTKIEEKVSAAGNNYLMWEFTINEGEFADRKLWVNTVTSGRGAFKLKEILSCFDVDLDGLESIEPDEYLGNELICDVVQVQAKSKEGTMQFESDGSPKMRNEVKTCRAA